MSIQGSGKSTSDVGEPQEERGDPLEVAVTDTRHTQAVPIGTWKSQRNTESDGKYKRNT